MRGKILYGSAIMASVIGPVASQDRISFPVKARLARNNVTGCSVKQLEPTLRRWTKNVDNILVAYGCGDAFSGNASDPSMGFLKPSKTIRRQKSVQYQQQCKFGCIPGYRLFDKDVELKGRGVQIKATCNAWTRDPQYKPHERVAKWRILNKYRSWSCRFMGSEGLAEIDEPEIPQQLVIQQRMGMNFLGRNDDKLQAFHSKDPVYYPPTLIPIDTCAFKNFLVESSAASFNRLLISSVQNWHQAGFGSYDILTIRQPGDGSDAEHHAGDHGADYRIMNIVNTNTSLIYRADRVMLRKFSKRWPTKEDAEFRTYYGSDPIAFHFKRTHHYKGMLREFTLILFTSKRPLREFDLIPFIKELEYQRYPSQYLIHGSLAGKRGCLQPYNDNSFTLLSGRKYKRHCNQAIVHGDDILRSACNELLGAKGAGASFTLSIY